MVDQSKTILESFGHLRVRSKGVRLALSNKGNDGMEPHIAAKELTTRVLEYSSHVCCFTSEAPIRKSKTDKVIDRRKSATK